MDLRPYKIQLLAHVDPDTGEEFWVQQADAHNEREAAQIGKRLLKALDKTTQDEIRIVLNGQVIC